MIPTRSRFPHRGLDRPLVKPDHFRRFVGEKVRIVMQSHILGRRRFTGLLVEADDTRAEVEVDGESYTLPYDGMESARVEPVFDNLPRRGKNVR